MSSIVKPPAEAGQGLNDCKLFACVLLRLMVYWWRDVAHLIAGLLPGITQKCTLCASPCLKAWSPQWMYFLCQTQNALPVLFPSSCGEFTPHNFIIFFTFILFESNKYRKQFCQVAFPVRPWFEALTVDKFLNYLPFSDCILLISGAAFRYSCTPTCLPICSSQQSKMAPWPWKCYNICLWRRLFIFLADFVTADAGHVGWRGKMSIEETRGRQREWCELNRVFMEHYFPPWKMVIGNKYQTGDHIDDSHDLPISIVLASGRHWRKAEHAISMHARENRPGRPKLWHTVSKRCADVFLSLHKNGHFIVS